MPVTAGRMSPIAPSSSATPIKRTNAAGTSFTQDIFFFKVASGEKAFILPASRNARASRPWTIQSVMFIFFLLLLIIYYQIGNKLEQKREDQATKRDPWPFSGQ